MVAASRPRRAPLLKASVKPTSPRHWHALALAALLAGAVPAQAQSLLQLYESARGYDASVQSALAQAQAAQARADQARAGLLPQLGLQAGAQRNVADTRVATSQINRSYSVYNAGLVGTQPLYRPANRIAWDQGKQAFESARVNLAGAEQDLIVRLAQAYFDVLGAQDALASVQALKTAVSQQLAAAQRNFEVGNATITDSREAQARFDLAVAQEIAAENDLHVKKLALDQLVGQAGVQPLPLAKPVTLPAPQPSDVSSWVNQSAEQHPGVVQARMALDIARLETDKARAAEKPTVDLQASLGQTRYPDGNPGIAAAPTTSARVNNASIGVVLNWPLFAGYAIENRVKETLALQDKARSDLDALQRSVAQATRAAFFGVQSGLSQVKALEAAEQSSLTALQANEIGYRVGVRINIDVLNSLTQLYQTQRDLARARYDVLVGGLRLKQAAGALSSDDVAGVNALLASSAKP
ncbi:MAG: TolC family outer membrane protein [Proteobacteria bacterium]|nr:TolC family outer membrane protein [Pseudomonadota bacterium]